MSPCDDWFGLEVAVVYWFVAALSLRVVRDNASCAPIWPVGGVAGSICRLRLRRRSDWLSSYRLGSFVVWSLKRPDSIGVVLVNCCGLSEFGTWMSSCVDRFLDGLSYWPIGVWIDWDGLVLIWLSVGLCGFCLCRCCCAVLIRFEGLGEYVDFVRDWLLEIGLCIDCDFVQVLMNGFAG